MLKKIVTPEPFKPSKSLDADCTHEPVETRDLSSDQDYLTNLVAASLGLPHDPEIKSKFNKDLPEISAVAKRPETKVVRMSFSAEEIASTDAVVHAVLNHHEVLSGMYKKITAVNFEEIIKVNGKKTDIMYQIAVIDEILEIAKTDEFRLCQNDHSVYLYNGVFWKKTDQNTFMQFLGLSAVKMGVSKWTADSHIFKKSLVEQFNATAYLPKPEPDKNKVLINLLNGTMEFNNGIRTRRSFNSKDFLTYQLPFSYNENATAEKWIKFLNRVLPDVSAQNLLAEYLGYLFIKNGSGVMKAEKCLILYGNGKNGKSVVHDVINGMLGGSENVTAYPLQDLIDVNGYYRAMIDDKILNYATEISHQMNDHGKGIFKNLTSGEKLSVNQKYAQPKIIYQYAKLIFNCNTLPRDTEQTNAFFRRLMIIPFTETITEDEINLNLASEIIAEELSGVFNWVLLGLDRILENKSFSYCKISEDCLNTYRHESDNVSLFLTEENFTISLEHYTLVSEVYSRYLVFCSLNGCRPLSKINLNNRLKNLGVHQKTGTGGMQMLGIYDEIK